MCLKTWYLTKLNLIKMDGKKISEQIKRGAKIKIVNIPNKKHEKSILEFRLFTNDDVFINITKFQALKHLTNEQMETLKTYEYVKKNIVEAPFNVKLSWNLEIQKGKQNLNLNQTQIKQMVLFEAITKKQYLELN